MEKIALDLSMAATRRGTKRIGRSLVGPSMAATGGEQRDREITLDQNHLWTQRGGPTQRRGGGEEVTRIRGGRANMAAFP